MNEVDVLTQDGGGSFASGNGGWGCRGWWRAWRSGAEKLGAEDVRLEMFGHGLPGVLAVPFLGASRTAVLGSDVEREK